MEIPQHLKQLYSHWEKHTHQPQTSRDTSFVNTITYSAVRTFITKRMNMWELKTQGKTPPYSDDAILNTYRFCNIHRELDRQTIVFHTLLKPTVINKPLWIANMFFCRFIANTETVLKTGLLSLDTEYNESIRDTLRSLPSPKYGTPYVFPISAIQKSLYPTREDFFCMYIPTIVNKITEEVEKMDDTSVADAVPKICTVLGFNLAFHVTEVLIDIAYQYPKHINLFKPFPVGPGSRETISQLVPGTNTSNACTILAGIQNETFPFLTYNNKPVYLSAENWEGIGCEYRKYNNLLQGKGRKRIYRP